MFPITAALVAVGYGMRTGCLPHRCVMMAAALSPLMPPDSSSALQPHTSSASRAMWSAGKVKSILKKVEIAVVMI